MKKRVLLVTKMNTEVVGNTVLRNTTTNMDNDGVLEVSTERVVREYIKEDAIYTTNPVTNAIERKVVSMVKVKEELTQEQLDEEITQKNFALVQANYRKTRIQDKARIEDLYIEVYEKKSLFKRILERILGGIR